MDVSLNFGTPISHPKMILFSRKTHSCWAPSFELVNAGFLNQQKRLIGSLAKHRSIRCCGLGVPGSVGLPSSPMALPAFCDGWRCRVLLSTGLERVQCISHRIHARYIICLHLVDYILKVNVAKYTIHGSYGYNSWWFQPIWKICSSHWIMKPQIGVNIKTIFETTT